MRRSHFRDRRWSCLHWRSPKMATSMLHHPVRSPSRVHTHPSRHPHLMIRSNQSKRTLTKRATWSSPENSLAICHRSMLKCWTTSKVKIRWCSRIWTMRNQIIFQVLEINGMILRCNLRKQEDQRKILTSLYYKWIRWRCPKMIKESKDLNCLSIRNNVPPFVLMPIPSESILVKKEKRRKMKVSLRQSLIHFRTQIVAILRTRSEMTYFQ